MPEDPEYLELNEEELSVVKKEIYEEAFKKFEELYKDDVALLSTFFSLDYDSSKDKTQTMRVIFKFIKAPLKKYIDFDLLEMPIPFKYDNKMVLIRNPHEQITTDVINRLNFLLEVRPSCDYTQVVT